MGLIASAMPTTTADPGAMVRYGAEFMRFQQDYPSLKGTPALAQRAVNLYNIAKANSGSLNDMRGRFMVMYGDSPELSAIFNEN